MQWAVEIAREHARSGNTTRTVETVLKEVYYTLVQINDDVENKNNLK